MVLQESRIGQYAREQRGRAVNDEAIASLESEVDGVERLNLRLRKELLDETTLRVRSEGELKRLKGELEDLNREIEDREKLLDERVGRPQRIGKNVAHPRKSKEAPEVIQRVDGSPASKRGSDVLPSGDPGRTELPQSGDDVKAQPKSARVRGTVT